MNVALIGSVSSMWYALGALIRGGVDVTCVLGVDESHAAGISDYRSLRRRARRPLPARRRRKEAGSGASRGARAGKRVV